MATPCDLELIAVNNDPCGATELGKQPVMILIQSMAGVAPDLTTVPANGTDGRLAALQAAITATDEDKIFVLNNIAGGTLPAATDETISGNDVPRGGTIVTGRERVLTGRADYLTQAASDAMDNNNRRGGTVRAWLVDENDYVQGPFNNARVVYGSIVRPGLGNATTHRPVTMTHRGLDEPTFASKPLVGVASVTNA